MEQKASLLATMQTFNKACDWLSERAAETKTFTHFKLQKANYHDIRRLFGLSAQSTCLVCAKVADAYAISKIQRKFRPNGSIIYDLRLLSWKLDRQQVSIWAMPSRLSIPYACGERQAEMLGLPKGQTDLIYRDGKFFLHVTVDLPDVQERVVMDMIGVDLGIACIAYDSDGTVYSGKTLNKVRHRNKALRVKLQRKGTKSAKRLLKKRSKREANFAKNCNHVISKRIVTAAARTNRGVAIEDLKGIRSRVRAKKDHRYTLHSWAFGQLGSFLEYKCRMVGIPCVKVDPSYTSQQCSKCGHTEKANRKSRDLFVCRSCGHTQHADGNGAENVRLRGLALLGTGAFKRPYAEVIPTVGTVGVSICNPLPLAGGCI